MSRLEESGSYLTEASSISVNAETSARLLEVAQVDSLSIDRLSTTNNKLAQEDFEITPYIASTLGAGAAGLALGHNLIDDRYTPLKIIESMKNFRLSEDRVKTSVFTGLASLEAASTQAASFTSAFMNDLKFAQLEVPGLIVQAAAEKFGINATNVLADGPIAQIKRDVKHNLAVESQAPTIEALKIYAKNYGVSHLIQQDISKAPLMALDSLPRNIYIDQQLSFAASNYEIERTDIIDKMSKYEIDGKPFEIKKRSLPSELATRAVRNPGAVVGGTIGLAVGAFVIPPVVSGVNAFWKNREAVKK